MKGFYSIQPRYRSGRKGSTHAAGPDPYGPTSVGYAERHTVHTTELAPGLIREDIGEPLHRLPSETQPVCKHRPKSPTAPVPVRAPAAPLSAPKEPSRVRPREHRAITRNP